VTIEFVSRQSWIGREGLTKLRGILVGVSGVSAEVRSGCRPNTVPERCLYNRLLDFSDLKVNKSPCRPGQALRALGV
jgi:hypothetical protein